MVEPMSSASGPSTSVPPPVEHDGNILGELRRGLLDDSTPVSHLLRLCLMLGQVSGSSALVQWAEKELSGYANDDELPSYRMVPIQLAIDGQSGNTMVKRQLAPASWLPEEIEEFYKDGLRMQNGIGDIEEMARSSKAELRFPLPMNGELCSYITHSKLQYGMSIHEIYWLTGRPNIAGVIDQVKTKLAKLTGELIRMVPADQEAPTSTQAGGALHVAFSGDHSSYILNAAQGGANSTNTASHTAATATEPTDDAPAWWKRWRRPGVLVVGVVGVIGAVAGVGQWLGWIPL